MKLGIFLPNWVGDVVMATPTLRALRNHVGPRAEIVGILRPYVVDVLAGTKWLDRLLLHDPHGDDRSRRGWAFVRRLRAERFDTIVLMTHSLRSGLLSWASGAPRRVGFVRNGRGPLLTHRLYHRRAGGHYVPAPVLDDYLRLSHALGCPAERPRIELACLPADEDAADAAWSHLGLAPRQRVVALNCGGAFGSAKLWPAEYFAQLARRIARDCRLPVLVLCGPGERDTARHIAERASHPGVHSLADEPLSIGLSKACIRRSRLLVTTDSGPRHFAAAFDVPVITLFGPTHVAWSENYHRRAIHLQLEMPCGPCQQRVCPLAHHRCMTDLSVDQVYAAVTTQLNKSTDAEAA